MSPYRLMAGTLTFNQRIRVRISLGTPLLLLSTNGRSSDFQSENTGSIPVKSTIYLFLSYIRYSKKYLIIYNSINELENGDKNENRRIKNKI